MLATSFTDALSFRLCLSITNMPYRDAVGERAVSAPSLLVIIIKEFLRDPHIENTVSLTCYPHEIVPVVEVRYRAATPVIPAPALPQLSSHSHHHLLHHSRKRPLKHRRNDARAKPQEGTEDERGCRSLDPDPESAIAVSASNLHPHILTAGLLDHPKPGKPDIGIHKIVVVPRGAHPA